MQNYNNYNVNKPPTTPQTKKNKSREGEGERGGEREREREREGLYFVGMNECPVVVLACESLRVCTLCTWHCKHARFCVEVSMGDIEIFIQSFNHLCERFCRLKRALSERGLYSSLW